MRLYDGWEQDWEQRGSHGYWYRCTDSRYRNPSELIACEQCGNLCLIKERGRFCSLSCSPKPPTRKDENAAWKGGSAGYHSKHARVYRLRGRATHCVWDCQADYYSWANLTLSETQDDSYDDRYAYVQMCAQCHRKFDWAIGWMMTDDDVSGCAVCGRATTSKCGVCQRTAACRRERQRRIR